MSVWRHCVITHTDASSFCWVEPTVRMSETNISPRRTIKLLGHRNWRELWVIHAWKHIYKHVHVCNSELPKYNQTSRSKRPQRICKGRCTDPDHRPLQRCYRSSSHLCCATHTNQGLLCFDRVTALHNTRFKEEKIVLCQLLWNGHNRQMMDGIFSR